MMIIFLILLFLTLLLFWFFEDEALDFISILILLSFLFGGSLFLYLWSSAI